MTQLFTSLCSPSTSVSFFFFFTDTATTEIYTLSLHDALPICEVDHNYVQLMMLLLLKGNYPAIATHDEAIIHATCKDRKSTRLNSSHVSISYAVFCLKKKNSNLIQHLQN